MLEIVTIQLQTLGHKFGGSEESKYIFTPVGMKPWGRYVSGFVELFASILIVPRTIAFSILHAIGTMSGLFSFI